MIPTRSAVDLGKRRIRLATADSDALDPAFARARAPDARIARKRPTTPCASENPGASAA